MALFQNPFYTITVNFQDRDLNVGSTQIYVGNNVLVSEIITALDNIFVPGVTALSDATYIGWSISRGAVETTPALAPETSDVERKGIFTFVGANNRPVTMQIPSIKNTLVVDRTNKINATDAAVVAFTNLMVDGAVMGLARPVTVTGADIVRFKDAYKAHRGSSQG